MTLSTGVRPSESRNTPTPTSILSGRGSALQSAISARSESSWTGGRSARPRALVCVSVSMRRRLAKLCVVIHRNAVAERHRLTGQHVTGGDLLVGEAVARCHLDLALGDFGAAGGADACLARERCRKPGGARAVENVPGSERHTARAAVARDRHRQPLGLAL